MRKLLFLFLLVVSALSADPYRHVGGSTCQIGSLLLTKFGQLEDIVQATAESAAIAGCPIITGASFDTFGFTANELLLFGDSTTWPSAPNSFHSKRIAAQDAYIVFRQALIDSLPTQLGIQTSSPLSSGTVSVAYSLNFLGTGGVAPYTWGLASGSNPLPGGLSLSGGGALTGTPTTANTFTFTVEITDSATPTPATATKGFSLTISVGPSGYSIFQDEGTPLASRSTVDCQGTGITCSDSGGKTVITVAGGAAPVDNVLGLTGAVDWASLTEETTPAGDAFLSIVANAGGTPRKVKISNLPGGAPGTDSVGTDELDDGSDIATGGHYPRVDPLDTTRFEYRSTAELLSDIGAAASSHNHAAADINSGTLALARGGLAADLSATGGPGQVLKQSSAGAVITVSQLAYSDLSGIPSEFTPTAHALIGAKHTASGLTTGHVVRATGATTFAFGALQAGDLPSAAARKDQANVFTAAGGLTMDNQLGIRLRELGVNGSDYVEIRGPASLTGSSTITWAAAAPCSGTNGGALTINGSSEVVCSDDDGGGGAGGDNVQVNSINATDLNFLDQSADTTNPATTWTLNTGPAPDQATMTVGAASGSVAGILTAVAQTLGGQKTFADGAIFRDNNLEFQDNLDNTKKLLFQLSAIGSGSTRTWTAPDANGEVSLLGQTIDTGEADAAFITTSDPITDLSDVAAKSGSGTTVVFATAPTFTTSITTPVVISGAADPADAGAVRLGSGECVGWEVAPAGTDETLCLDGSEILQSSATFNAPTLTEGGSAVPNASDKLNFFAATSSQELAGVLSDEIGTAGGFLRGTAPTITTSLTQGGGDAADSGFLRLLNAALAAWERATPGVDATFGFSSSDVFEFSDPISIQPGSGLPGRITILEGTAASAPVSAGQHTLYVDSSDSKPYLIENGASSGTPFSQVVASGTAALGTSAINSESCATVVSATATGAATTDAIVWAPNVDITAVTGYAPSTDGGLAIYPYPTANNVNFKVCNPTSASITPGAVTLNWRVVR